MMELGNGRHRETLAIRISTAYSHHAISSKLYDRADE